MAVDSIIAEVRQTRDASPTRFNYDLRAMIQDARERQYEDADLKTNWFRDDVRFVQEALCHQAHRHLRLDERERAKERMTEAAEISSLYGVALEADERHLLRKLATNYVDS